MALQKRVIELPFDKGMDQKFASEVAPDGLLHTIENADLSHVGKFVRRAGFTVMSSATLAPSGFNFGSIAKLASRHDQLIAISTDSGGLGSGAGLGSSGDTLYSYSEQYSSWKAHAKLPRPTLDTVYSFSQDSQRVNSGDVAVYSSRVALMAFTRTNEDSVTGGVYAIVYDLLSNSLIREPTLLANIPSFADEVKCLNVGTRLYAFWTQDNAGTDQVYGCYFDVSVESVGFSTPVQMTTAASDVIDWDICTDGTSVFVAYARATSSSYVLEKFSNGLVSAGNATFVTGTNVLTVACSTAGGIVHVIGTGNIAGAYMSECTTSLTGATVPGDVFSGALTGPPSRLTIASLSASVAFVFAYRAGSSTSQTDRLWWHRVSVTSTRTVDGSSRFVGNVRICVKPFYLDSRLYIGLGGGAGGADLGYALCEIDVTAGLGSTAAYTTPMPVAAWGTDVAVSWNGISSGSVSNGELYVLSGIQFRNFDVYRDQSTNDPSASWTTLTESGIRLTKMDFSDSKRWKVARHGDSILFAGAVPYCFDGTHAFNCGFIWRPIILECDKVVGAAVLPSNETLVYRATYEFWDTIHRRWNSVPSLSTEGMLDTGTDTAGVDLVVFSPTLSSMPRGGHYFFGSVRVCIWRSKSSSPDEFILVHTQVVETFTNSNVSFTDTQTDDVIAENERMYTWGGELENYAPPPCRAIVTHRDRIFAINSETNELWYTKPLINGRGVEWSRYQKLPLFEKGIALGATEAGVIILTDKGVYALQGTGPSITGNPPDAFSRLYQISGEIGCAEDCAAFSTPVGVVFRGRQGLWLVDKAMSLRYIGAPVEEFMSGVTEMLSGDVDDAKGVVRFLVYKEDDELWYTLNYWYDTNRWSYDTCGTDTLNSAVMHNGSYYQNHTASSVFGGVGVWKMDPGALDDAGRFFGMKVKTHWLRFGNMGQVKRIWRVAANVKVADYVSLKLTTEHNFRDDHGQNDTFTYVNGLNANDGANQPRAHIQLQKSTAIRITLQELEEASDNDTLGSEFLGLTFELGLKPGAAKMKAELTA